MESDVEVLKSVHVEDVEGLLGNTVPRAWDIEVSNAVVQVQLSVGLCQFVGSDFDETVKIVPS